MIIAASVAFMFSCEKSADIPGQEDMDVTQVFDLENSIILSQGDCAGDFETNTFLCFEEVLNDSRCPEGVQCFWAGNAEVKFKFVSSVDDPLFFSLNTHPGFTSDTIVGGYKFTLVKLDPYPTVKNIILHKTYKAEIEIESIK